MVSESNNFLVLGISVGVIGVLLFNIFLGMSINTQLSQMGEMHERMIAGGLVVATTTSGTAITSGNSSSASASPNAAGNEAQVAELAAKLIPTGVPAVYGPELGISFDDPINALNRIAKFDGDLYPDGEIKFSDLTPEQQQRYIKIGQSIACEYCCGATTMVQKNGQPSCACAHSASMRGVVKYLLKNHESEYSDEQLLEEAARWKALSFPKQTVQKALQLASQGGEVSNISINSLPSQVGGC